MYSFAPVPVKRGIRDFTGTGSFQNFHCLVQFVAGSIFSCDCVTTFEDYLVYAHAFTGGVLGARLSASVCVICVWVCVCGVVKFNNHRKHPKHTCPGFGIKSTSPRRSELWCHDAGERGCKIKIKRLQDKEEKGFKTKTERIQYKEEKASR